MIDPRKLDRLVLSDLHENYTDEQIERMTPKEAFDAYLAYNGHHQCSRLYQSGSHYMKLSFSRRFISWLFFGLCGWCVAVCLIILFVTLGGY